jgi:Protein of unknown function (DUF2946)
MRRRGPSFWSLAARTFFVPFLAYFLAAQTILMPLSRAKASEAAGLDAAVGILCLTPDQGAGQNEDGSSNKHPHDLGCCLPGSRFVLDTPIVVLTGVVLVVEPARVVEKAEYILPQGRAPPAMTATPSQSRAPPIPA